MSWNSGVKNKFTMSLLVLYEYVHDFSQST